MEKFNDAQLRAVEESAYNAIKQLWEVTGRSYGVFLEPQLTRAMEPDDQRIVEHVNNALQSLREAIYLAQKLRGE